MNGENSTPFKLQASLENVQEFRVESSSYPAEFGTGTGGQVSVITKSGAQPRSTARSSSISAATSFDAPNYFDSQRNADGSVIAGAARKSPLKQNQFGGSVGGPLAEGPGVLLRQLRRLSAGRRQELHRGRAERRRVGARRAGGGRRCGRASRRRMRVILPGASTNPDFDIAQLQDDAAGHGELLQRPRSTSR